MTGKPEDFLVQVWKKQLDAGWRMLEALVEGATRVHEMQLEAAAQAHADAEATRQAIAAAADAAQVLKAQTEWARANVEKSAAYWRSLYQAVIETNAALVNCARGGTPVAVPEALGLELIDSAYKKWLDAAQRFYRPAEKVSA